jgi:hypothetical protein
VSHVSNIEAFDVGDDVLRVTGQVDGEPVEARGWLSATTNHYPPTAYAADGHLKDGAKSQKMTEAQVRAYCRGLLLEAAAAQAEPTPDAPKRVL